MGVSIGLVGLGAFGTTFAQMFKSHPLVDRVALCDRETERMKKFADDPAFADKFDAADAYASLDEICEAKLDAVAIITQPWLHAPQAIQAMESGKHVYSAVPIISLPDSDEVLEWCDRLIETSRRTGMRYMLGETTYYHADTMYCRKQAAAGAFGDFVYSEGEYYHDYLSPYCNLKDVRRHRLDSQAGQEWLAIEKGYVDRGVFGGPMAYPTHSTSGPISVMGAHATKVSCFGYLHKDGDEFFKDSAFSNETALFQMSNGATMRICEAREIGNPGDETFRVFGTKASYGDNLWVTNSGKTPISDEEMRDPLPLAVQEAFGFSEGVNKAYGGHGGSHPYLVHEFVSAVAENRQPATNAWEAARYMAPGAVAHKSALRDGELLSVPDWGDAPA